jgi:hypothetical protein
MNIGKVRSNGIVRSRFAMWKEAIRVEAIVN